MDGWNTIVSFWVSAHFQVRTVSSREGKSIYPNLHRGVQRCTQILRHTSWDFEQYCDDRWANIGSLASARFGCWDGWGDFCWLSSTHDLYIQ